MISLATIKSENLGLDKNCTFKVLPIEEIDSIKEKFDGAFSSFGPLNCTDDMEIFAKNISKLINKGGIFIASVMNKYCIAEVLNYTIRLQFKRAFRRFGKQPKTISLNDNSISFKCFYYSFKKFYKYFKSDFELINIIALPLLFTPDIYFENYMRSHKKTFSLIKNLDSVFKKFPLLRSVGDHFLIILKRK